ncbi:MAG TPA: division/cell wall cluster transcriptional repressor MraZ [Candidatus Limnocylindria bacterium]|nr:division/cell wall cluster transcriptional repressor MraZ [Candidatus Limnocylindria bacterium]
MIFRGRFEYTIDPKGRVNIPSRFREQLSDTGLETIVITNYSGCLYAYPTGEWERIEEKLASKVSSVNKKKNAFVRFFVGGAVEVTPDKQGRILIPPSLRSYAGLDREVVILGMPNRFEIWDRERWDVEVSRFEKEGFEDPELVREIDSLGI